MTDSKKIKCVMNIINNAKYELMWRRKQRICHHMKTELKTSTNMRIRFEALGASISLAHRARGGVQWHVI